MVKCVGGRQNCDPSLSRAVPERLQCVAHIKVLGIATAYFALLVVVSATSSDSFPVWLTTVPHMPTGKVWIYRLLFVCLFVFVRLRIFPPIEDKASGVKFCTVVHRRPWQGISHFWGTFYPRKPQIGQIGTRRVYVLVRSACVDNRQSPSLAVGYWILLNSTKISTKFYFANFSLKMACFGAFWAVGPTFCPCPPQKNVEFSA